MYGSCNNVNIFYLKQPLTNGWKCYVKVKHFLLIIIQHSYTMNLFYSALQMFETFQRIKVVKLKEAVISLIFFQRFVQTLPYLQKILNLKQLLLKLCWCIVPLLNNSHILQYLNNALIINKKYHQHKLVVILNKILFDCPSCYFTIMFIFIQSNKTIFSVYIYLMRQKTVFPL